MANPNINKQGIWTVENIYENWAFQIQEDTAGSSSYTPTTGTNSTINDDYKKVMFTDYSAGDAFAVTIKIQYSGFDESNESGTFALRFQGKNYNTSAEAWQWAGTNPIAAALNTQRSPRTEVLSQSSGTYVYKTSFTLTSTFLETYSGSTLGMRSDYSNGTGQITISDFIVTPIKSANIEPGKAKIGEDYMTTNEFYEI